MLLLFVPEFASQQLAGVVRDLSQPLFQGLAVLLVEAVVRRAQRGRGGLFIAQFAAWYFVTACRRRGAGLFFAGARLARAGELEAAIDAYEQALEAQPDLQPALKNKALVESLLLEEPEPEPPTPEKNEDDESAQPGQTAQPGDNSQQTSSGEQSPQGAGQAGTAEKPTGPPPPAGNNEVPGSELGDEQTTTPPLRPAEANLDEEHRQALEQWLRQIPDNPGELLRRKFWYEQQQHQDKTR